MLKPYLLKDNVIHGNLIEYKNQGLLLLGASGSGKSLLSYQLITQGAKLVADDIVQFDDNNIGQCPKQYGHMEIYGLGIIELTPHLHIPSVAITHIFFHQKNPPRLYEKKHLTLGKKEISYSDIDLSHHFSPTYISIFCDMLNGKQVVKNSL